MHVTTKAIVLSKLKYKDYDLIVKCYTEAFGIQSYLLRNIFKSKKGKLKPAYFQLFSLLELEADHKPNRSLQYIKEVKRYEVTTTIDTDIIKTTIVLFLSEILTSVITEEEPHSELYQYLETSIKWFDVHETYSNFHLIFLIELTKYLGFYPEITDTNTTYFDLEQGKFLNESSSIYTIQGENLTLFKQLLGIKFDGTKRIIATSQQKRELLNMILLYFKLHLTAFKEPKSLTVLNQVFN